MKSFSTHCLHCMIFVLMTMAVTEGGGIGSNCLEEEGAPCDQGFVCGNGVCRQVHGGTCIISDNCVEGFYCYKGKCICPDPSTTERKCGQLLGSRCTLSDDCPKNGVCKEKRCRCIKEYLADILSSNCLASWFSKSGAGSLHAAGSGLRGLRGLVVATLAWLPVYL